MKVGDLRPRNRGALSIVPIVNDYNPKLNAIYGYQETLITYNWLNDSQIVFSTPHDASDCLFLVGLHGNISEILLPLPKPYSALILDVHFESLLLEVSNPRTPEATFIASLHNAQWTFTKIEDTVQDPLSADEESLCSALSESKTVAFEHTSAKLKSILKYSPRIKILLC